MGRIPVKQALLNRQVTVGSWLQVGHPANAEILARAGFDWLAVDCEHGDVSEGDLANIFRAVARFGTFPMVRVKENATLEIRRALDLGAMGVVVPLVNTPGEAARAVAAARYPPEGVRGFAFHRGNEWKVDFDDYMKRIDDITVIVMIESKQAVDAIDAILAVEGVDGVFIGPYDMSGSYGVLGQTGHEVIRDACCRVSEACARAGKSAGLHVVLPTAESVRSAVGDGFTLLGIGMDTVFLVDAAAAAVRLAEEAQAAHH